MATDNKVTYATASSIAMTPGGAILQMSNEQIKEMPNMGKIMVAYRKTIADFRTKAEEAGWFSSYLFEMKQAVQINKTDLKLTQSINEDKNISGVRQCTANSTLTVAHFFETTEGIPIPNTKIKLEPVTPRTRLPAYPSYIGSYHPAELTDIYEPIEGAEVLQGTTNDKGLITFDNCTPHQHYRVTVLPDITYSDLDNLYQSYEPMLQYCAKWLTIQWGANEAQANAVVSKLFATKNPDPKQIELLYQELNQNITGGFKQSWDKFLTLSGPEQQRALEKSFVRGIGNGLWEFIKSCFKVLLEVIDWIRHPQEHLEKLKKMFDDFDINKLKEKVDKLIILLNDKGLLFILFATFAEWLTMLPPEDTAYLTGKILTEIAVAVIVGIIATRGAGLAVRVSSTLIKKGVGASAEAMKSVEKLITLFIEIASPEFKKLLNTIKQSSKGVSLASFPLITQTSKNILTLKDGIKNNTIFLYRKNMDFLSALFEDIRKINHQKKDNKPSHNENGEPVQSDKKTTKERDPISMVTGEELLSLTDGYLNGLLGFEWKRIYRTSAVENNKGLGFGWSHSLSHSLTIENDTVYWTNDENITTELPLPTQEIPTGINNLAQASIYLDKKTNNILIAQADGQGFYHFKQTELGAQLEAITDKYNNRLSINRDMSGKIHRIHNNAGRALMFRYHAGHIIGVDLQQEIPADTYEQSWKTLHTIATYHYNEQGQLSQATNALGESEHYRYDEQNVIQERTMTGGATFYWEWQNQGKASRATRQWSNFGQNQTYQWDDNGTVLVTNEDGSQRLYSHDQNANLLKEIDVNGAQTLKTYDEQGNLTAERNPLGAETKYVYNDDNSLSAVIPPNGQITQYGRSNGQINCVIQGNAEWLYEHNEQGDITQQTDPDGHITRYEYTPAGKIKTIIHPDGSQHHLIWNKLGQLIEETLPQGGTRRYRYDSVGNQTIRQDENGNTTQYQYDLLNRLIAVTNPDNTTKQYQYNAYGNVTKITDEQGRITRYDYLPNLNKIRVKTNPDGSQLHYQYNHQLNITQITNEQGEHYHLDYYPNGLISQETSFDGRTTRYQYDLAGNLTAKIEQDAQGNEYTTTYLRSQTGKLLQETLPDGKQIHYRYTPSGRLASVDNGHWPINYEYDNQNRLIAEHQGWATLRYQYNPLGNLSQCQLPDGNLIQYHYHKGAQLNKITLNDQVLTKHIYNQGLEIARQQGNLTSEYQYDAQGRLKSHYLNQQNCELYQRHYHYAPNGNLKTINDSRTGERHYHYDPLDRLIAVRGDITENLIHDPAGNLLSQDNQQQRTKLQGNRLLMQGDKHFTYDDFGNLIQERRGQDQKLITHYQYTAQHQLQQATLPDGTLATYQYDPFGRRIAKTVTSPDGTTTQTQFIWMGDNLIAERSQHHYQSYLYEPYSQKPLALLKGRGKTAEIHYYQLDHLGTPQALTRANGRISWSAKYKAYGNLALVEANEIQQPLRFQGQYHDLETGLYYNYYRYYDPSLGRYTTPDPIKLAGGLNNYQYTQNPINQIDPLGLVAKDLEYPKPKYDPPSEELKKLLQKEMDDFPYLKKADKDYKDIRNTPREVDIETVSKNTGVDKETVELARINLFEKTHDVRKTVDLGEGKYYSELVHDHFDADAEIAFIWKKAQQGELTAEQKIWFKKLADHEAVEHKLMYNKDNPLPYRDEATFDHKEGRYTDTSNESAHDSAPKTSVKMPQGFEDY